MKYIIFLIISILMYGCGDGGSSPIEPNISTNDISGKTAISSSSMIEDYHQKCTDLAGAESLSRYNQCISQGILSQSSCYTRYQSNLTKTQNEWETRSGIAIATLKQCIVIYMGSEYAEPSCIADFNLNLNYVVQDCVLYLDF